jgi:hypothetical protein
MTVVTCNIFTCDNNDDGVCRLDEMHIRNREAEPVCHSESYLKFVEDLTERKQQWMTQGIRDN